MISIPNSVLAVEGEGRQRRIYISVRGRGISESEADVHISYSWYSTACTLLQVRSCRSGPSHVAARPPLRRAFSAVRVSRNPRGYYVTDMRWEELGSNVTGSQPQR